MHNENFYKAVVRNGSLAFGETYMADWWDVDQLDELIARLFTSHIVGKARLNFTNFAAYASTEFDFISLKN